MGQNIRTSLAQQVAEELRVAVDSITMVMGDTDLVPWDAGTFGSRTTPTMGPQLRAVAATARETLLDLAASRWQVSQRRPRRRRRQDRRHGVETLPHLRRADDGREARQDAARRPRGGARHAGVEVEDRRRRGSEGRRPRLRHRRAPLRVRHDAPGHALRQGPARAALRGDARLARRREGRGAARRQSRPRRRLRGRRRPGRAHRAAGDRGARGDREVDREAGGQPVERDDLRLLQEERRASSARIAPSRA